MKVYLKSGESVKVNKNTKDYLLSSMVGKISAVHRGDGAGEIPCYFNLDEIIAIY